MNFGHLIGGMLLCTFTLTLPAGAQAGMEQNTDRPGLDYRSFDLPWDDPAICQEACDRDGKCQAWTYVRQRVQGPYARCWLKHQVPRANANNCCISGVKVGSTPSPPTSWRPSPPPPSPQSSTRGDCSALRKRYETKCSEMGAYFSKLNCQRHGYSGCALDVAGCFTPFLPGHVFTDDQCGNSQYTACATEAYDRYLQCLSSCNQNSIDGRLPEGLRSCGTRCLEGIKSEIGICRRR